MSRDEHARGQQKQTESRDKGFLELIIDSIFGHDIYDPPSDPEEREQFFDGVKNASNNPPKR